MARITGISASGRNPERRVVKVDGQTVVTLPVKVVSELGLRVDDVWDDALAQRVERARMNDCVRRDALRRLERRAMSRRRLADKLRQKGYADDTIAAVLDRLEQVGLLNDLDFGRALIREITRVKPAGPRLLRDRLFKAGLAESTIAQLLAEVEPSNEAGTIEQAVTLARRRLATMSGLDAPTRRRRLWGVLARRGFDPDTIEQVMRQIDPA